MLLATILLVIFHIRQTKFGRRGNKNVLVDRLNLLTIMEGLGIYTTKEILGLKKSFSYSAISEV